MLYLVVKICIIIPVYNEGKRSVKTIKCILKNTKNDLIVIDDGSIDESYLILKKAFRKNNRIKLLHHILNLGKGAAMKTGAEKAWELGAGAIIFIDADGQHNPKHLKRFQKKLEEYSIVFGYRVLDKKMPLVRKLGNIFASYLISVLFNIKKKDLLSGYLGFRKDVYETIMWHSCRYGIETEMATKIGRNKLSFCEIKIDTIYIDKYKGVTILDALNILFQIPFWYFSK
jgi:glycosyltransferase involved in cell wall biosynthesis